MRMDGGHSKMTATMTCPTCNGVGEVDNKGNPSTSSESEAMCPDCEGVGEVLASRLHSAFGITKPHFIIMSKVQDD